MDIRKDICSILKNQYPVFTIDRKKGIAHNPYFVVKFSEESKSLENSLGSFVNFEVLVYVPSNSISPMNEIISQVKLALVDVAEFTGRVTEDYFDDNVNAYMRSIEFRVSIAN